MSKIKGIVIDVLKSIKIATLVMIILSLVVSLIVGGFYGFNIRNIFITIRSALFIPGSFALMFVTVLLFKKDISSNIEEKELWKEKFHLLNFMHVTLIFAILLIAYGSIADYIAYIIK